jgi:signal transduction histidine kinase
MPRQNHSCGANWRYAAFGKIEQGMAIRMLISIFFPLLSLLVRAHRIYLWSSRTFVVILFFVIGMSGIDSLEAQPDYKVVKALVITSVRVNDKSLPIRTNQGLRVGADPGTVTFYFGPATNSDWMPNRLRYRLAGWDDAWHEGNGEMNLTVRFYDKTGDQVSQKVFNVMGNSAGWNGSLKNSSLTHRRETVTVPPLASRLMVVISSAGPPATEGVYVVANLTVSEIESNKFPASVLVESPLDQQRDNYTADQIPNGWVRDGTHPSMAKIINIGHDPVARAFAVLDDDPISHAEWRNSLGIAPQVTSGSKLVLEWNEMYSMGLSDVRTAAYQKLTPGSYNFEVQEIDIFGAPTGIETSLKLFVPPPFWRTVWFWGAVSATFIVGVIGLVRYMTWHKVRRELIVLKSQQALEHERLRIAQDIHDDLGARVTQISLLSAMAQDNSEFSEKARSEFAQVSQMSRDLVAALYETVWAVNPENDNLDAMGNYICQMVTMLCERSQLRCRFYVSDLPKNSQVSSQSRHNLSMVVKEAVHNVIKHAGAAEVVIRIEFTGEILHVSISDDGCGFEIAEQASGNGLINMKRRLEDIGGTCSIESESGKGTTIHLCLTVSRPLAHSSS